jgi:hypothetical protein
MQYKNNLTIVSLTKTSWLRGIMYIMVVFILSACAHPITINPLSTPQQSDNNVFSTKVAGYVITDADRAIKFTTKGGGGDEVSYYPYKDLEKGIRDVLKSLYSDAVSVSSSSDLEALKRDGISMIYVPQISTSSSSDSMFTWPPTQFSLDISSVVTDLDGKILARLKATGHGAATFSEFRQDFGLAGRRAAQDALNKLASEIRSNQLLK